MSILKNWRKEGLAIPVIILTARGSWSDRVDGIAAGADRRNAAQARRMLMATSQEKPPAANMAWSARITAKGEGENCGLTRWPSVAAVHSVMTTRNPTIPNPMVDPASSVPRNRNRPRQEDRRGRISDGFSVLAAMGLTSSFPGPWP